MKFFGNSRQSRYVRRPEKNDRFFRKFGKIACIALLCLALLIGAAVAAFWFFAQPIEVNNSQSEPAPQTDDAPSFNPPKVVQKQTVLNAETGKEETLEVELPAAHTEGVYNVLVCGTDNDGYRTDTIIIAHLDANAHQVTLLSIPRDTMIESKSGVMKINSVYAGGGEEGMERLEGKLKSMLGFETDGYILVGLEAFKKSVDLVGGVDFDVPMDMNYEDPSQDLYIHLQKGQQTLDGEKAMELVRFRKGYASQDIQRTKVQQDFLRALAKKCVSFGSLTKIGEFIDIFKTYVTTDMTAGNMAWFAEQLLLCDYDAMQTYTAEGAGMTVNGVSYYPLYAGSLLEVINESFNPYDAAITADNLHIITPELAKTYQRPEEPLEESEEEQTPPDDSYEIPPEEELLPPESEEPAPEDDPFDLPPDEQTETDPALPEDIFEYDPTW